MARITNFSPMVGWSGRQEAMTALLQVSNIFKRTWTIIYPGCPWLSGSVTQISWLYLANSAKGPWPPALDMSVKCGKWVLFLPHIMLYENRAPLAFSLGSCHSTRFDLGPQISLQRTFLKGAIFIFWSFADQVSNPLVEPLFLGNKIPFICISVVRFTFVTICRQYYLVLSVSALVSY